MQSEVARLVEAEAGHARDGQLAREREARGEILGLGSLHDPCQILDRVGGVCCTEDRHHAQTDRGRPRAHHVALQEGDRERELDVHEPDGRVQCVASTSSGRHDERVDRGSLDRGFSHVQYLHLGQTVGATDAERQVHGPLARAARCGTMGGQQPPLLRDAREKRGLAAQGVDVDDAPRLGDPDENTISVPDGLAGLARAEFALEVVAVGEVPQDSDAVSRVHATTSFRNR